MFGRLESLKATTTYIFATALASLVLVGCPGRGGSGGGDSLAVVNGEAISMDEFHRYLERKPAVQITFPQSAQANAGQVAELPVAGSLGFQALRDLVNRRILLQVAKDKGVLPTDAEVKTELEFQTKRRSSFVTDLVGQGLTIDDIRRDLTLDLAKEKIVTQGITVTPIEVDKFIKDNPTQFESPAQAKLRFILVKDAKKKAQVDASLASGTPFGTVAQQYSDAPNARQQGEYVQTTVVTQMPPIFQEIVKNTSENKASDWTAVEGQWLKVFVERKVAAKKITVDDTLKQVVKRQLALKNGSERMDLGTQLVAKLKQATVVVTPPYLKKPWDAAWKNLKEQDVQSNTRTGGTAGTAGGTTAGGAPRAPASTPPAMGTAPVPTNP